MYSTIHLSARVGGGGKGSETEPSVVFSTSTTVCTTAPTVLYLVRGRHLFIRGGSVKAAPGEEGKRSVEISS